MGGVLIALGGPTLGWRLVFFVNIPVAVVVLMLSRRYLPLAPGTAHHRLDFLGAALLGLATFCVLFACVEYDALHDRRLAWLGVPAAVLLGLFLRRERRLTDQARDPLVDLRLFRRPSYVSGITLALTFFPAMAGLPLVLALYYQFGLGYSALASALGVTAYAVGSAISAPLSGRVVTRVGRPLVVGGAATFGLGAVALAVVARHVPDGHATLALAAPLFVMGCGQGMLITPNQTLALMDVDPLMGSTAGGVLQTGQRIGLAIGQALIGAVFFNSLTGTGLDVVLTGAGARGHRRDLLRRRRDRDRGVRPGPGAPTRRLTVVRRSGGGPRTTEGRCPLRDTGPGWTTGVRRARPPAESLWPRPYRHGASARYRSRPAGTAALRPRRRRWRRCRRSCRWWRRRTRRAADRGGCYP